MGNTETKQYGMLASVSPNAKPQCSVWIGGKLMANKADPHLRNGKWYCPPQNICNGMGHPSWIENRWHCIESHRNCTQGYHEVYNSQYDISVCKKN